MTRITAEMRIAFEAKDDDKLCDLLGLRPWEMSPLDVDDGPCVYPRGSGGAESWPLAVALRTGWLTWTPPQGCSRIAATCFCNMGCSRPRWKRQRCASGLDQPGRMTASQCIARLHNVIRLPFYLRSPFTGKH